MDAMYVYFFDLIFFHHISVSIFSNSLSLSLSHIIIIIIISLPERFTADVLLLFFLYKKNNSR